jgi:acyl carrier protein
MNIDQFIIDFASCFDDTDSSEITASLIFKDLDEWDSLTTLAVIGMCKKKYNVTVTGMEVREASTVEDLYNLVLSKK